jgi:hypothetical protein
MVKVEMEKNDEAKIIAFQFTSSSEEDLDVLDALRTAMFGGFAMRGGYTNSNVLVVQVKTDQPE